MKPNLSNSNFPHYLLAALVCAVLTAILPGVTPAGGNDKIDGIDRMKAAYRVPENLTDLSDQEIAQLKQSHEADLVELQEQVLPREVAEAHMFAQLMHYCDVGLEIIEVIPVLVDRYELQGEYRKKLLTFRDTFKNDIAPIRANITNLQEFKSYDFRYKLAYLALLHALQENPEIARKIEADSKDEESAIGQFKHNLGLAYQELQVAKNEMDVMFSVSELEKVITALDQELVRRGH